MLAKGPELRNYLDGSCDRRLQVPPVQDLLSHASRSLGHVIKREKTMAPNDDKQASNNASDGAENRAVWRR